MKVFNKLDKFGGSGSPDGWVSVVIRNNILDELRKRKVDYAEEEPEWGRLGKGRVGLDTGRKQNDLGRG